MAVAGVLVGVAVVLAEPAVPFFTALIALFGLLAYPMMKRVRAERLLGSLLGGFVGMLALAGCCRLLFMVIY